MDCSTSEKLQSSEDPQTSPSYVATLEYSAPQFSMPDPKSFRMLGNIDPGQPVPYNIPSAADLDYHVLRYGDPHLLYHLCINYPLSYGGGHRTWDYKHRREAQRVLRYLYLGPVTSARDEKFLRSAHITMAVSVRPLIVTNLQPGYMAPSRMNTLKDCETTTFDFDSTFTFTSNLASTMQTVTNHIERLTPSNKRPETKARILVFCDTGNERSITFIAAFLMIIYGISASTALDVIQSYRYSMSPSFETHLVLDTLQDILSAQRHSAAAKYHDSMSCAVQPYQPSSSSQKRGMEDMDDDEHLMDSEMLSRPGVAPFEAVEAKGVDKHVSANEVINEVTPWK